MKLKGVIVDADFCIKVGASPKYRYLERVLPELAEKIYIHRVVYNEILIPVCAKEQIDSLIIQGKLKIIDENNLDKLEKLTYQGIYQALANVMINPKKPKKNQGETCSIAMAKAKGIPYFATDEKDLQQIIDKVVNTGIEDVICVRIEDIIERIKTGELASFKRKEAKVLWRLAGKCTDVFDKNIWPI